MKEKEFNEILSEYNDYYRRGSVANSCCWNNANIHNHRKS